MRLCRQSSLVALPLLAVLMTGLGASAAPAYEPGKSYFGRGNYTEYIAGDMPLILSAPHGGRWRPAEIPDRKRGTFAIDTHADDVARTMQQVFHSVFGRYPHVIICRLERHKVDCNRPIEEGAGADARARQAWTDYQEFIEGARSNVLATAGAGLYIDLHGHAHAFKRIELGYGPTGSQLTNDDRVLNGPAYADRSTIRSLVRRTRVPFSELLRGTNSLGALLAAKGFPAVPSSVMPNPGPGNPYFNGGYNARRHGSGRGDTVDGLQMELHYRGVRDSAVSRRNFSLALAQVLDGFFTNYYKLDLRTGTTCSGK
jgi:hypothetical protein